MKENKNSFAITGYVAASNPRTVGKANVCHFAISVARLEGTGDKKKRTTSLLNVETWCKNEDAEETFKILTKGNLVTVEGFLKATEWVNKSTGEIHNQVVLAATNIHLAKDIEK